MKSTNSIRKRYLLIADLQSYATPYASLYITDDNKALYVFVRTSNFSESGVEGIMAQVTVPVVKSYLNGKRGLRDLMLTGRPRLCDMNPTLGTLNWSVPYKYVNHKISATHDTFDDDFCMERGRLSYFLKQHN